MPINVLMRTAVFATMCLLVCMGIMQSYSHFRYYFSGAEQLKAEVAKLNHELEGQKLRTMVAMERAEDLRQSVAAALPPELINLVPQHAQKYQLRSIASVTQTGNLEKIRNPQNILQEGKEAFRKNHFEQASKIFESLVDVYPWSPVAPEALFLAVECQFQLERKTPMITLVEEMVSRYPESDLTGFALLRLSEMYVQEGRKDDAIEIVDTVVQNFPNGDLRQQAEQVKKRL